MLRPPEPVPAASEAVAWAAAVSYTHLDEDRDQLLSSMKDGGVGCIVNVCASAGGFDGTLKLMEAYPFVYGAVGVHPDDAGIMTGDTLDEIRRLSHLEKMVAIGEIGPIITAVPVSQIECNNDTIRCPV